MPASYRIDLRAGVVFTLVGGYVTNEELLTATNMKPTSSATYAFSAKMLYSWAGIGLIAIGTQRLGYETESDSTRRAGG